MDSDTNIMTFLAANEYDAGRVPALLGSLGVTEFIQHDIAEMGENAEYIFTIKTRIDAEGIYTLLERVINNDARFLGMEQCYLTLREGFRPGDASTSTAGHPAKAPIMMLFSK